MICLWSEEPLYFFIVDWIVQDYRLFYYSHIPASVIALLVGFFVFLKNPRGVLNRLLLAISLTFFGWTFVNMIAWTNIHSDIILFGWTFFGTFQALLSIFCIYFIYAFTKREVSAKVKGVFLLLLAPVLLLGHTDLNISGFDLTWCDAFGYEGQLFLGYYTALGILAILWIFVLLAKAYKNSDKRFRIQILLMGSGIELFLLSFFTMTYIASKMADLDLVQDSNLEFYGLFGMTVFMIFISILITRFKTFKVGANAAIVLVFILFLLVASQLTYVDTRTAFILTGVTLALTLVAGYLLVKSVRREVKQREDLEDITLQLERANERLKELDKLKSEFVSIASHQLRSPLTAIRGYASLLLDGSYGKVPQKAVEALQRISDSSKNMAYSIEDYLNVSRIESGNMKYNLTDFNLRDETEKVVEDLRPQAIQKGLGMIFRTDLKSSAIINADIGKVIQIVQNLINNSIKYTENGSIKVFVRDDLVKKKVYIDIEDTGVGMSPRTQAHIFGKFERADNANKVNHKGTGLGLYVAQMMAKGMGGNITAFSEGEGKGSLFTIEMPLAM